MAATRRVGQGIMLGIEAIDAGYGPVKVLDALTLAVPPAGVMCLMGRNGAGKTTLMRAIMGLVPVTAGRITLDGKVISNIPAHMIPREGIGYVPQGRRLFTDLTVAENLEVGLIARNRAPRVRERVLALFPRLRERLGQVSSTLSGGEQQMLAVARALCLEPKLLLLDEPTEGLQPSMVALIRDTIGQLRASGVATILVEQRVDVALSVADRIAFVAGGTVAHVAEARALRPGSAEFATYVGV